MYVLLCAYAGGGFASSLAAEGITASCEYVNVMTETIEQGSSELFVPEHLDPLGERQIGGDDGRAAFIALGQQVKQQFTPSALERHEARLIDDQKRDFLMALLERGEPPQIERRPPCGPPGVTPTDVTLNLFSTDRGRSRFRARFAPERDRERQAGALRVVAAGTG